MNHPTIGRSGAALCLLLATGLLSGCAKEQPAKTPEPASEPTPDNSNNAPGKDPKVAQINIDPSISEACGIPESEAYFAYNSSKVSGAADAVFAKLVECFTTGPLAGRTMRIVGHADPRGDEEYNMALGGRRSDNVAAVLAQKGMPKAQTQTSSRGEIDARGTDEASWSKDRKVEILLARN